MTTTEGTVGDVTRLAPQDADFVYHEREHHISNSTGIYLFDTTAETTSITQAEAIDWMRPRLGYSECSPAGSGTYRSLSTIPVGSPTPPSTSRST